MTESCACIGHNISIGEWFAISFDCNRSRIGGIAVLCASRSGDNSGGVFVGVFCFGYSARFIGIHFGYCAGGSWGIALQVPCPSGVGNVFGVYLTKNVLTAGDRHDIMVCGCVFVGTLIRGSKYIAIGTAQ